MISHIVAMSKNKVIGREGKLPWKNKTDLEYFKNTTLGHCVIMGRKTFESIKRPLPNRLNVVISRSKTKIEGAEVFSQIEEAINYCKAQLNRPFEIFVCGGSTIYQKTLDLVDKIYMTYFFKEYDGDVYYPELGDKFKLVSEKVVSKPEKVSFRIYKLS